MASHTWNPTTARSARKRESGVHDSLHHVRIYPAHGGLLVEHHTLQSGLGGMAHELGTAEHARPSVEAGAHVGAEFPTETRVASRHVIHSMDDLHEHLDGHLGQMMEAHEKEYGENAEPEA